MYPDGLNYISTYHKITQIYTRKRIIITGFQYINSYFITQYPNSCVNLVKSRGFFILLYEYYTGGKRQSNMQWLQRVAQLQRRQCHLVWYMVILRYWRVLYAPVVVDGSGLIIPSCYLMEICMIGGYDVYIKKTCEYGVMRKIWK